MSKEDQNIGVNFNPHSDERIEGAINDSTSSSNEQMGVRADFRQKGYPFHEEHAKTRGLEEFERITRGERTKDEEIDK